VIRKGIVLAGGRGTRLDPLTRVISKQLLPVYDKPLIYYPIATLMVAGIRDLLLITTPRSRPLFEELLGDGGAWGVRFSYAEQPRPGGIAQALLIGRDFLDGSPSALVLGDNIFYGHGLTRRLQQAAARLEGATIFGYPVDRPQRYGVLAFDEDGAVADIVEKPDEPPSSYAVTGLYMYDGRAPDLAAELTPSARGELEITDLNRRYLELGCLEVELLGRGYAWLDAGTPDSLHEAAGWVRTIEARQGLKVSCPEEVAFRMGLIDAARLRALASAHAGDEYAAYLERIAREPAPGDARPSPPRRTRAVRGAPVPGSA
jgi:glucose-1-phosphate thymidylyltransferase